MKASGEGLNRVIGVRSLATSVVNMTVGAGIFALAGVAGEKLGAAALAGYLVCACLLAAIMLCYAETGSRIASSGGAYAYVEAAFGPFAGYVVNWLIFFGYGVISDAAIINILPDSLAVLFPQAAEPVPRFLIFLAITVAVVWINVRGIRQGLGLITGFTIVKLVPLALLIVSGLFFVQPDNFRLAVSPTVETIGETALVLFFAFGGFETSLNNSGEIRDVARTVPAGILLGGTVILVLYVLVQLVAQGVLGDQLPAFKDAPLAAVAGRIAGPAGSAFLALAAAVSAAGSYSGDLMASPRVLYAGARDGLLPAFLAGVHPRYGTPHRAIVVYAALILAFAVSGRFRDLAVLASASLLLIYMAVVMATIRLRLQGRLASTPGFTMPGGMLVPALAAGGILWLLYHLSGQELTAMGIFLVVLCLLYLGTRWLRQRQAGPQ